MGETKQDYLLKPSVIARRRREGLRVLKNKNNKKHKSKKKMLNCIDESRICYDRESNELLCQVYLRIVDDGEIRSFISKHRLATFNYWSILAEIRHNFSNYDEIRHKSVDTFESFPRRRNWFYKVLKWEINNLITETYGNCFKELQ